MPDKTATGANAQVLDPETQAYYCHSLGILSQAGVPFLVGGAYAFARYTGIERHTKDFDIFVKPEDVERALKAFEKAGYKTEVAFSHWLAKAYCGDDFMDVIFGAGNGVALVDDEWFEHAVEEKVLGMPVKLIPPEEMIWSKAFIMERERYDGADVAHVIRALGPDLDWDHLLERFGEYWRVLFSHLVLFGFIYPGERDKVPARVMEELMQRLKGETGSPAPKNGLQKLCRGTILSRGQYLVDVEQWGYTDVRRLPENPMSRKQIKAWTDAIEVDGQR